MEGGNLSLIDELLRLSELSTKDKRELAGLLGDLSGDVLNLTFSLLPPKEQEKWKQKRPLGLHHGDVGYIIGKIGEIKNSDAIAEYGRKLRETDRPDEKEWLFKDDKRQKKK